LNSIIGKYQVNLVIRKHQVFKPRDREVTKTKVLIKNSRLRFQVNQAEGKILVLVKRNCQIEISG
jgi:hypothetical protein